MEKCRILENLGYRECRLKKRRKEYEVRIRRNRTTNEKYLLDVHTRMTNKATLRDDMVLSRLLQLEETD